MTLIFDLGLNRPPPELSGKSVFEMVFRETSVPEPLSQSPHKNDSRTLEERRAFLGIFLYYICVCDSSLRCRSTEADFGSVSKFQRGRIDPLWISPYVLECLEALEKAQDQPSDVFATSLVRLQLMVERISQCPWSTGYGGPGSSISGPPPMFYVKSLQEQLKNFRSSIPSEVALRGR
jgi:hypothetical protein